MIPSAVAVRARADVAGMTASAWLSWSAGAVVVLAQILYSMSEPGQRFATTAISVVAFAVSSVFDAVSRFGARAAVVLVTVAGGGGLTAEALGVHTGFPFGDYTYTGTLGVAVFAVPVLVPLAWIMMAWPAFLVGRSLGAGWWAVPVGGWALASWDVFLDPQMVDEGHWRWLDVTATLPGVHGIPLSNFAGWLLVATVLVLLLHRLLPDGRVSPPRLRGGAAPVLYLWTYFSSVWAHAAFFGRPWVSLVGGLVMGAVALPFARTLRRGRR
ncbi:carotenoid biosynthesis protein [Amycolatopsis magusensis]|uniref:carotenoid biosynthesis protein n=1 Tax=Amycolatopsis magusensis TaxID=882444 RepID=UPI0027DF3F92|nr:carotenoid biosynthesis protein [Amycolatopsis magusensis]